jgi:hypothetical protein
MSLEAGGCRSRKRYLELEQVLIFATFAQMMVESMTCVLFGSVRFCSAEEVACST